MKTFLEEAWMLSSPPEKSQVHRAALALLHEHEARRELPTSVRFIHYEAEQAGVVSKIRRGHADRIRTDRRGHAPAPGRPHSVELDRG